jgi:hypothetical protein
MDLGQLMNINWIPVLIGMLLILSYIRRNVAGWWNAK